MAGIAALSLAVGSDWAAASDPNVGTPDFQGTRDYVVLFDRGVELGPRLRSEVAKGNKIEDRFTSSINGAALELDAGDVARLERDDRVLAIEPNMPVTIAAEAQGTRQASSWGLDRVDQRDLPFDGRIATATDGAGVEVYVIDTGIRLDHTQFTGRINPEGFSAFAGGRNDCNGHGTHVAGTVAGSTYGVAPAAQLTAVRVLDCDGGGTTATVVGGIDWAIQDHRSNEFAVANMSLGGGSNEVINAAVERAVSDGITTVVAAGNEAADACGKSPASAPAALTVGSINRDDWVSSFSNVGRCVDLYAPGSNILSASIGSRTATETMSGTSMASPHVAGAAALFLPWLWAATTPQAVENRLLTYATPGRVRGLADCSSNLLLYLGTGSRLTVPPPSRPPNDLFSNRQTLTSLGGVSGSNHCATGEAGEPIHDRSGGWPTFPTASIWYRWVAPASGTLSLSTRGTGIHHELALYSGARVDGLTKLDSDLWRGISSDAGDVAACVTSGVSYSIAINGYPRPPDWDGEMGNTRISGSFRGDDCLTGASGRGSVTNLRSTDDPGLFTFDLSASPYPVVCPATQLICSWYPEAFVVPGDSQCSRAGTSVWFGGFRRDLETQSTTSTALLPETESWRFCIYVRVTGGGDHLLHEQLVASPEGPGQPGDPGDDPKPVELSPPTIESSPSRQSTARTARFRFSGEEGTTFQCRLDRSWWWSRCSSPLTYRSLRLGRHTFRVRQTNGQVTSEPTLFSWKIGRSR